MARATFIRSIINPIGKSSRSMSLEKLLMLSCPALMNSSLPDVTETFTDIEPGTRCSIWDTHSGRVYFLKNNLNKHRRTYNHREPIQSVDEPNRTQRSYLSGQDLHHEQNKILSLH